MAEVIIVFDHRLLTIITSLCLSLPFCKCSYTCPCLIVKELQGQLRCLIPKQEKSQGGNSSVSNSRRCCTHVSHGSSGTEKMCQLIIFHTEGRSPACLCLGYSQRAKSEFYLFPYRLCDLEQVTLPLWAKVSSCMK